MSSTHMIISNKSDIDITAILVWGIDNKSRIVVGINQEQWLPCEYWWYDLQIYIDAKHDLLGNLIMQKNGVYGNSNWTFSGDMKRGYFLTMNQ